MKPLLLGIDLGTSAVKCLLLSPDGTVAARTTVQVPMHCPRPGWMEQAPDDWCRAACHAVRQCVASAPTGSRVAAVGSRGT